MNGEWIVIKLKTLQNNLGVGNKSQPLFSLWLQFFRSESISNVRQIGENMKRKILITLILIILPVLSFAGEKENLAEEIMKLTDVQKMMDQFKFQMQQMQFQMMEQVDISEKYKGKAIEFQSKIQEMIFNELSWDKMKSEYVKLFTDVYTIDELRGIAQFYKSPIGQSLIKKQPIIFQKSMMISQSKMQNLIPKLKKMTEEFAESIKEK